MASKINASKAKKVSVCCDWKWAGWLGAFLVIFGYILNANMYTSSWLVWIIGNALVGIYSVTKEAYPTAIMSFIIMIMNIYGYMTWL